MTSSYGAKRLTLIPRISELYGASGNAFRVGEADAYIQDLEELEREEKAFENTVHELVNRQASVPIGVKFHREGAVSTMPQDVMAEAEVTKNSEPLQTSEGPCIRSSLSAEEEEDEEDEEDMSEDEMMDEDDEQTTGRATIVRGEEQQRGEDSFARDIGSSDDSFARELESDDDSMEMEELPPPRGRH